jgi:hypothetical protein
MAWHWIDERADAGDFTTGIGLSESDRDPRSLLRLRRVRTTALFKVRRLSQLNFQAPKAVDYEQSDNAVLVDWKGTSQDAEEPIEEYERDRLR